MDGKMIWKIDYSITQSNLPEHSDKVILPETILNDIIIKFGDEKLPHPLIFKISTINSSCFIGVKEFGSALVLPVNIQKKLGLQPSTVSTNVHIELTDVINEDDPYIKIQPITKVKNDDQWKSILEAKLPQFYTVITSGDRIHLPVGNKEYIFNVLKVKGRNVCVVDKDIELLIDDNGQIVVGDGDESRLAQSEWPKVFECNEVSDESIHLGVKMDKGIRIKFNVKLGECISSDGEFIIGEQFDQFEWCSINENKLGNSTEKVWINEFHDRQVSIYSLMPLNIKVGYKIGEPKIPQGQYKCNSCGNFISKGAQIMHESFCQRNNVKCPKGCNKTYLKSIPESHWHCCDKWDESPTKLNIHEYYLHDNGIHECDKCGKTINKSTNYEHAVHMGLECPMAEHVCMYCHLLLPRGEQSYEARYHNMSEHEWTCGSKTIDCDKCKNSIRLRDLKVHMTIHDKVKNDQMEPLICSNILCVRMRGVNNGLGLCDVCFGPFHSTAFDPEGKILMGKIERRFILGIKNGCKISGCLNELCRTSNNFKLEHLKNMIEIVKYVKEIIIPSGMMEFCVDDSMAIKGRVVNLIDERWSYGWKCKAIDVNGVDLNKIDNWLQMNAPEQQACM